MKKAIVLAMTRMSLPRVSFKYRLMFGIPGVILTLLLIKLNVLSAEGPGLPQVFWFAMTFSLAGSLAGYIVMFRKGRRE